MGRGARVLAAAGARLLLPALAACTGSAGARDSPSTVVFAAASLTDAFRDLGAAFERRHPGTRVRFNFAGSNQLAVQLEHGAEAHLFASADERWMRYAAERGLLDGAPRIFARNRLVVVTPASDPERVHRLADLARPGLKLVLAASAVPAGRYGREALARLERAPAFPAGYADRVLANLVSEEETVRAVVAKVQLGEADAGIVYASDAQAAGARLRVVPIPDAFNVAASYPIAVLRDAPPGAAAFLELVLGSEGQRILERHGLIPAAAPAGMVGAAAGR